MKNKQNCYFCKKTKLFIMTGKIYLYLFSAVILFLTSCSTSFVSVKNIKEADYLENRLLYTLPKTVIVVEVELRTVRKHKGPFYKYAKKYLGGAKDVIMNDETFRQISGINITSYPEPDTNNIYAITYSEDFNIHNINLTKDGFLAGINLDNFVELDENTQETESFINTDTKKQLSYSDYSLEPALETQYDTLYKEILVDSAYVKVPVIHKKLVNKSKETQAKELADQIFLLRDDKNALLKGENDGNIFPDGEALKTMLSELDKLESDYMNLFTGKTESSTRVYRFEYRPENTKINDEVELFRLSGKYGILPVGDLNGKAVTIKITGHNYVQPVNEYVKNKDMYITKQKNAIFYRSPDDAGIEILINFSSVARKKLKVAQFGTVNILPSGIFTGDTKVEFYPDYGSLKSISK